MQRGDEIIKSLSGLYGFNLIGRDLTGEIVYIIFIYEECNVTLLSRLEESIPILLLFFLNLDEFCCRHFDNFPRRFAKIVTKDRRA